MLIEGRVSWKSNEFLFVGFLDAESSCFLHRPNMYSNQASVRSLLS